VGAVCHLWAVVGGCHGPWFVLSFVGSCLCFLASRGGSAAIDGHWHLWAVMKGGGVWLVAVTSMVGGGGKKRWWWWKKRVVVFGEHDCQTNIVCYQTIMSNK